MLSCASAGAASVHPSFGVLHVDDDPHGRDVISTLVGCDRNSVVRSCASVEEALVIIAHWSPDLILLDLDMPGKDDPVWLIPLQDELEAAGVPVICITASAIGEHCDELKSRLVAGVIGKPIDPITLRAQINKLICQGYQRVERSYRDLEERASLATAIVFSSEDAIIAKNVDGTILSWNGGAERLFHYTAGEAVGQNIRMLIPEPLRPQEDFIMGEMRDGHAVEHFETVRLTSDGCPVNVSLSVSPIYDRAGKLVGVSKVARDIGERVRMLAALKRSEERYAHVISGLSVGVWDWDLAEGDLFWSDRLKQLLGLTPEFVPSRSDFESRLHPDDRERVVAALCSHLGERTPYDIEYRLRRADGNYAWIHATCQAVWDAHGSAVRVVGSIADISIRKQAEETLRELKAELEVRVAERTVQLEFTKEQLRKEAVRLATVTDTINDGLITLSREGDIQTFNPAAARIFGYAPGQLIGRNIRMLLSEPHHALIDDLQHDRATEQARATRTYPDAVGVRSGGQRFPIEIVISPMRMEGVDSFVCTVRDLTEFRRAEAERDELISIIEESADFIGMADLDGNLRYHNRSARRIIGLPDDHDLTGMKIADVHPAWACKMIEEYALPAVYESGSWQGETGLLHRDGTEIPVLQLLSLHRDADGKPKYLTTIMRVITERKAEEREREQLINRLTASIKELDGFAYAAAHDLKAPLRVIDNASKWLEKDLRPYLNDDCRANLQLVRSRVARSEKLLADLLRFSRAGRETGVTEIIPGQLLSDDLVAMFRHADRFRLTISGFDTIRVARMPLMQILMDLISNAVHHHDKATGSIHVAAEDRGALQAFAVTDDGPGIPAHFHGQIFEMFQTLKPRDQVEGSGMGLAIVRKQVELSGGTISVESSEGNGSTFRFTLTAPIEPRGVNQ